MSIQSVIFDLDGTITRPILDFKAIRRDMGLAGYNGHILEALKHLPRHQQKKAIEVLDQHEHKAVELSELNPGAAELLNYLSKHNLPIGILTRNTHANAQAVAEKHNLQFDCIIGRDDGPVKPDPYGILRICEIFKVAPENTLMVGDYLHDMICAQQAGAQGVLLENNVNASDFRKYAVFTINNLDQLMHIIDI